ncbi:pyrimidine reductase family protein [Salinifilum ghardaiensis]
MHELGVDQLWPTGEAGLPVDRLERFYAYPEELTRPWVRVNFVSSLDGAVSVQSTSRGLSAPIDQRVLVLIRDLSDVVLVGAGTALAEGYRGVRRTEVRAQRRQHRGLAPVPPIAVVSARCSVSPEDPLITDALVPTIVLTTAAVPRQRRADLAAAGADVVIAGEQQVDPGRVLEALAERGLHRVGCEGGPQWFGTLAEAGLVDELCLTLSPVLVSGGAGRIAQGPAVQPPTRMKLASALHSESLLLLRYLRMAE